MEEFKVVYTLTDNRFFRMQIVRSIKGLLKYVDKENVVCIINPASNSSFIKELKKRVTVVDGNIFYHNLELPKFKYKIEMCDVDAKSIIFLDCDTLVTRDITELLDGEYDVYAREEPCRSINGTMKPTWSQKTWEYNLSLFNLSTKALPINDGFVIFKNRTHQKIKRDFIKYYKMYHNKEIKSPNTADNMHHNEFALSMAIANYNIKYMTELEHWYGWRAEMYEKLPYVIHVGTNKSGLEGYLQNLKRFNYVS